MDGTQRELRAPLTNVTDVWLALALVSGNGSVRRSGRSRTPRPSSDCAEARPASSGSGPFRSQRLAAGDCPPPSGPVRRPPRRSRGDWLRPPDDKQCHRLVTARLGLGSTRRSNVGRRRTSQMMSMDVRREMLSPDRLRTSRRCTPEAIAAQRTLIVPFQVSFSPSLDVRIRSDRTVTKNRLNRRSVVETISA